MNFCIEKNNFDFYLMYFVDRVSKNREIYVNVFCYFCGMNLDLINDDVIISKLLNVYLWFLKFSC